MSFTLLTLPQVTLRTSSISDSGPLAVDCLSSEDGPDAKLALVFRLGSYSLRLDPGTPVKLLISQSGQRTYLFDSERKDVEKGDSAVQLIVPPPAETAPHIAQDIETLDHLLTQYTDLSWAHESPAPIPPPLPARTGISSAQDVNYEHQLNIRDNVEHAKPIEDPDLHGRLVLMDESNGDIVGELPNQMNIREDSTVPNNAGSSDPVVLEMQPAMYDACTGARPVGAIGDDLLEAREVIVSAVPPEEQDWLMKGATLISQAISGSTSLLVTGISSASNYYISHTKPGTPKTPSGSTPPSPELPSSASSALEKVHALSGTARAATQRTSDMVGDMIARAVGGKTKSTTSTPTPSTSVSGNSTPPYASPQPQGPPPPYAVYTPKRRPQLPSRAQSEKTAPESEEAVEPESPKGPPGIKDKLLMSANLIITTVDDSARRVFEVSTDRLGAVVGHKYGPEAQRSTHFATHTARNVVLVYVDMRGFARRALLKKAGKEFVKARVSGKTEKPVGSDSGIQSSM